MEFDRNIAKLQGALCSLGVQEMLNKPGSLHDVVEALKKIICGLQENDKCRLAFYMVLNTRLSVSEELQNDGFVGLFINVTPLIEKDYLIIYAYHLNLQLQLFEIIKDSPETLGAELLDVVVTKLRDPGFHRDEFGIDHLYQLWQSVFLKICNIDKGLDANCCLEKFFNSFRDIYNLIQKVVITSMKVKGLENFIGCHLFNYFKAILFCLKSVKEENLPKNPIYKLSIHVDTLTNECHIKDPVNLCVQMIFDEMPNIVENITVDMWMTFSECYLDSDSHESVQMSIGCLVCNILEKVSQFDVPLGVLNCLSSFAINKSDLTAKAGIDEIILNVNKNERAWFEALLKHPGLLEKKSIECLIGHLHLASAKDLSVILNTCYAYLSEIEGGENLDLTKELFVAAIKRTPDCSEWVEKVFEKYRPNLLTTKHTSDELIKTFNKITKDTSNHDLICLCMQSPLETIKRICQIAINGSQQVEFVAEVLKPLKRPCRVPLADGLTLLDCILLKFVREELSERESQSLVNLVLHLGRKNFLEPSFFCNLLGSLKEHLEAEALPTAVLCLEMLKVVLEAKLFHVDNAAFLVFMSQVLEHLTWDLKNFSNVKAEGRELAVGIVALTVSELNGDGSDMKWARKEILKSWEGNQANFGGLLPRAGSGKFTSLILGLAHCHDEARGGLRKFLSGLDVDEASEIRASVVLSLFVLLPSLSFREWNSIFFGLVTVLKDEDSGKSEPDVRLVLDLFGSSLLLLTLNLNQDDDIFPCYKYCLRNFMRLSKQSCSKMNEASLVRTFERIILLLRTIDDGEKKKSCWEICSPFLMELRGLLKKRNGVETHGNQIKELSQLEDVKEATEALLKMLD